MSDTLLSYAFLTSPTPLQAGVGATLTLVVSNAASRVVQATSIVVTLPVGTNAKDLVADATGISVTVPVGWSSIRNGGEFRLTPTTDQAGRIGASGLAFVFAGVQVNGEPGTAIVGVDETAAFQGGTPAERSTDVPLAKFPRQFQVSDLTADSLVVDGGGTATLRWTGTPATYRMRYSPGNGPFVDVAVGNTGPFVSQPLYRSPNVVFTLVVSVAVPGQDQPLVLQRQLAVDVRALSIDRFDVLPVIVPVNGVAKVVWRTTNAVSVVIQPGNHRCEPDGSLYVVVPGTHVLTLLASDRAGNTTTLQKTVTADPALRVNAERYLAHGADGQPGTRGMDGGNAPGGTGGPGGGGLNMPDVVMQVPPLDLTGTSGLVRLVSGRGGTGGRGGDGGNGGRYPGGSGGPGGDGGDAGDLTVSFAADSAAGPPGQMIVELSVGQPGEGGEGGGGTPRGLPGERGNPGAPGTLRLIDRPRTARVAARRLCPAPSDTRLGYTLLEAPEEEGGPRMLTLAVSGTAPELQSLTVPLPLLSGPDGWTATHDAGVTTLTPPAGLSAGSATFTFLPAEGLPPALPVQETVGGETRTALFTLPSPQARE